MGIAADHGQRPVLDDEAHAIHLRALAPLFEAEGLDLLDYPGEGRHSEAVVAFNGGIALVYVRRKDDRWESPPDFRRQVLPLARRFWQAHRTGQDAPALEGALAGVFVRAVEADGWRSPYFALTPEGEAESLAAWFRRLPAHTHADAVHRLNRMASPLSGDILLLLDPLVGRYFGHPVKGLHGGES